MKKIFRFLLVLLIITALFTGCEQQPVIIDEPETEGDIQRQAVMVDDKLYYNTYQLIAVPRCGVMDGSITSAVSEYELPQENNQSNFGTDYEYQRVDAFHIDIPMGSDEGWVRFCTGECKSWHGANLCGVPTPPPDHTGSWFCMRYDFDDDSQTTDIFAGETSPLLKDDVLFISSLLEENSWETGATADCLNNIQLIIDSKTYFYHSDCGTLNDNINQRSMTLDDTTKNELNTVLAKYISLLSAHNG